MFGLKPFTPKVASKSAFGRYPAGQLPTLFFQNPGVHPPPGGGGGGALTNVTVQPLYVLSSSEMKFGPVAVMKQFCSAGAAYEIDTGIALVSVMVTASVGSQHEPSPFKRPTHTSTHSPPLTVKGFVTTSEPRPPCATDTSNVPGAPCLQRMSFCPGVPVLRLSRGALKRVGSVGPVSVHAPTIATVARASAMRYLVDR